MAGMGLNEFVMHSLSRQWCPGKLDCLLSLADWAVACGYSDPASDLRAQYTSEQEFKDIISKAGGAVPLVKRCADKIGLAQTARQKHGDIAIVGSTHNIHKQWGGIWDDQEKGWRVRFVNDYPAVKAHALMMWNI